MLKCFKVRVGEDSAITDPLRSLIEKPGLLQRRFLTMIGLSPDLDWTLKPSDQLSFPGLSPDTAPDFAFEAPAKVLAVTIDSPWGDYPNEAFSNYYRGQIVYFKEYFSKLNDFEKVVCFFSSTKESESCLNRALESELGCAGVFSGSKCRVRDYLDETSKIRFVAVPWLHIPETLRRGGVPDEKSGKLIDNMESFIRSNMSKKSKKAPAKNKGGRGFPFFAMMEKTFEKKMGFTRETFLEIKDAADRAKSPFMDLLAQNGGFRLLSRKQDWSFQGEFETYGVSPFGAFQFGFFPTLIPFFRMMNSGNRERVLPIAFMITLYNSCVQFFRGDPRTDEFYTRSLTPLFRFGDGFTHRFLTGSGFINTGVPGGEVYIRFPNLAKSEFQDPDSIAQAGLDIVLDLRERIKDVLSCR